MTRGAARLKFTEITQFWNSASIGKESVKARRAGRDGETGWEEAQQAVRTQYAELMGRNEGHHTVFHNTTAGVQRIFFRLAQLLEGQAATLLTTDVEYPGIMALLDEHWRGRLIIAEIAEAIWTGGAAKVGETLKQAFLLAEPDIVYVSHVARASGYRLDDEFLHFARSVNPRVVLIVDGAQAVGNIDVGHDLLSAVDFYVTSGHKWLCGRETLGLVTAVPAWNLPDPAQSYSRLVGSGGAGNLAALRSLGIALGDFIDDSESPHKAGSRMRVIERWNRRLATYFKELLKDRKVPVQTPDWPDRMQTGIVTIVGGRDALRKAWIRDRQAPGISCTFLDYEAWVGDEGAPGPGERFRIRLCDSGRVEVRTGSLRTDGWGTPMPRGGGVRFCFHYYHTKKDVEALVKRIHGVLKKGAG